MKFIFVGFGFLVTVLVFLFVWGTFLPKEKTYSKSFTFNTSVEKIWDLVNDLEGQVKWRSDVKEIKLISSSPEIWIEIPKQGPEIKFRTKEKEKYNRWEMEIIENPSFSGNWVGTFERTREGGTKLLFIEKPSIPNPFMRVFSHLFIDMDKTMDLYLENLATALGEKYEKAN